MINSSITSAVKYSVGGLNKFNNLPNTFGAAYGVALSTSTTSRKAYPRGIDAGAAITASAGAEYSLDGGAWTSDAGVWGTTKQIRARITSSADYETTVTATITIGGVAYAFPVTTVASVPQDVLFGGDSVTFNDDAVIW